MLWTRGGVVLSLLIGACLTGTAGAAHPGPPANDRLADAHVISALPFDDDSDASGATTEPSEPAGCFAESGGSLWYRFSPAEDVKVDISTRLSMYDTTLDVFEVGRADRPVDCDDNGLSTSEEQSRLQVQLAGGSSYLLRVGALGEIGHDQRLLLSVRTYEPFAADHTFHPVAQVLQDGTAHVQQAASCNDESESALAVTMVQGAGPLTSRATILFHPYYCSRGVAPSANPLNTDAYSVLTIEPDQGAFTAGPATIHANIRSCSGGRYAECTSFSRTSTIVLKPRS